MGRDEFEVAVAESVREHEAGGPGVEDPVTGCRLFPTGAVMDGYPGGGFHTALQASVALSYGTSLGIPVYFLDSDRESSELLDWFRRHIRGDRQMPSGVLQGDQSPSSSS